MNDEGWGFKLWLAFCAVLGVALMAVAVWLAVAIIGWLGRH